MRLPTWFPSKRDGGLAHHAAQAQHRSREARRVAWIVERSCGKPHPGGS
jgi:hypothetical protein